MLSVRCVSTKINILEKVDAYLGAVILVNFPGQRLKRCAEGGKLVRMDHGS